MVITIRKATAADLDAVSGIYARIHDEIEAGRASIGWLRDVYPTRATAEAALAQDELFVEEQDGVIVGAAILNKTQVDAYFGAPWEHDVPESEIMVLHTLVIDPRCKGSGLGREFEAYYERYALSHECRALRIDTQRPEHRGPELLPEAGLPGDRRRPRDLQRHPRRGPGAAGKVPWLRENRPEAAKLRGGFFVRGPLSQRSSRSSGRLWH